MLDAAGLAYARNKESAELRADRVQILPVNGAERIGGSSWQSLTRGTGSIEADFLNGEIVLMAGSAACRPAERGAAAAGQPGGPGPPRARERHAGRGPGPGGAPGRRGVAQNPAGSLTSTMWMRPGSSWWISMILPT